MRQLRAYRETLDVLCDLLVLLKSDYDGGLEYTRH